jgi:hypothetical protein
MKFTDSNLQDYNGTDFSVYKTTEGVTIMKFANGEFVENEEIYSDIILGKCEYCTPFYKNSFEGFTYDSVLIAGLGFGLLPNELSEVNNCSKIDVVEINQEVIDYNTSSGHLNPNINLIQGDIFTYSTPDKYDLIIVDTIWYEEDMSEEQYQTLVSNFYDTNLNIGGALYIPITRKWLVK